MNIWSTSTLTLLKLLLLCKSKLLLLYKSKKTILMYISSLDENNNKVVLYGIIMVLCRPWFVKVAESFNWSITLFDLDFNAVSFYRALNYNNHRFSWQENILVKIAAWVYSDTRYVGIYMILKLNWALSVFYCIFLCFYCLQFTIY